ncbi:uncharacterized protein LOC119732414 [Patiria miniata]|uniref:DUF4291 domain-containing protein n=1 Tax=Patiria miniata TaxID=46514 RepID=A0A914AD42_PATMI|nr:uncharacterized protein LOC119732414 [Patiria miniata]
MAAKKAVSFSLKTESYKMQVERHWPTKGRHILAQYDEEEIIVYQAFCPEIADYAVSNQRFGGPKYSFTRMSWIKTNFLWMMYRCGWASKPGQEKVLAIHIPRTAFDTILSQAYTAHAQKEAGKTDVAVRLQWDPDHAPDGGKAERKAIQLGLRGEILKSFATDWILRIEDITAFVREQAALLGEGATSFDKLLVARERVYEVPVKSTAELIGVDLVG